MATSLYELTIPTYLQTVVATEGFLAKGLAHCQATGVDPQTLVETRLFHDMHPLRFQVVSVAHHSLGALDGIKTGAFGPPSGPAPQDYAGLQQLIAETRKGLEALTPDMVNASEGGDVIFKLGEFKIPFTTENFVLSFSLPNFHFHAATAYDILRMNGVALGKRDFLGQLRMKV
jgi:hypothetical protein